MLNREQVTQIIGDWKTTIEAAGTQLDALAAMSGHLDYDAPLPAVIEGLIAGYTNAVGQLIGDFSGWLDYFRIDCVFGKYPLGVIPELGADEIRIDSPEAIAKVICWDREHGGQKNEHTYRA